MKCAPNKPDESTYFYRRSSLLILCCPPLVPHCVATTEICQGLFLHLKIHVKNLVNWLIVLLGDQVHPTGCQADVNGLLGLLGCFGCPSLFQDLQERGTRPGSPSRKNGLIHLKRI
eukprot:TRINITY_DN11971_c0_g4_i1.p1 TRINITY_DN11971_c0_g4~~TRINITY_DN11971_c0_g4_i1.p1  ORF type:complete len:116 (-),score=2.65 TRINITY_DN11971_c0_g4_i1:3-350(-)